MLRKKKVLAIAGVACIIVASLYVVYVAASPAWDIDDMVAWMENRGSVYIPRITRWTREIREMMLYEVAHVGGASGSYAVEGWMPGWHNVEVVDVGSGKVGKFTVSYAGKTADLQGIDAEAWIWLQITSDGAYWRTVETIHIPKPAVIKPAAIPYRTYEFAARGFRIRVLLHTQAGSYLTLNYAYFYEVLP